MAKCYLKIKIITFRLVEVLADFRVLARRLSGEYGIVYHKSQIII